MLDQAIHWMLIADTVLEGLLLVRIIALKLHRVYAFITLYCALNLLFDAAKWWLGIDSPQSEKIMFYSFFVFAAVYPLVAWDVFEEIKSQVATIRRTHAPRLVSGMFVSLLVLIIFALNFDAKDENANAGLLPLTSILLFTGSITTSLAFLWFTRRSIRTQKIGTSNNTFVWTIFVIASLILSLLDCLLLLTASLLKPLLLNVLQIALISCDLVLMSWCIFKLKAVSSDVPTAPEKAAL